MESLEKLLHFNAETLYPGHGPKLEKGQEKVRAYIAHRMAREKQVGPNQMLPFFVHFVF